MTFPSDPDRLRNQVMRRQQRTTKTLEQQTDIYAFCFKNRRVPPKWQAEAPATSTESKH